MAKLKFLSGPLRGSEHDFEGELVIGRADSDLDIDDPQISRRHLRLRCVSGAVLVEDLDSSNGTFVDDRRLTAVATVHSTAVIGIGQTKFELIGAEARADATRVASADRTRISDGPPATDERTPVTPPPPQPPRAAPPPPPPPGPAPQAPPAPAAPIGAYAAVAPPRPRRGPATRLLAPAALTALIIVAVAAALLVYFATR